jgi:hypothetical protein
MKLKNIIPQRYRNQVVRQFGNAKLIRLPNGQHELVGGTDAGRADFVRMFVQKVPGRRSTIIMRRAELLEARNVTDLRPRCFPNLILAYDYWRARRSNEPTATEWVSFSIDS